MFSEFAEFCEYLERFTERTRKVSALAEKLRLLDREYIRPFSLMIIGRVFPDWQQKSLDVSWSTIARIITGLFRVPRRELVEALKRTGDIGDAVKQLYEGRRILKQLTLLSTSEEITILDVFGMLNKIAEVKGEDSRARKESMLYSLMSRMSSTELKILMRIIFSDMRHGVNVGILEEAISKASGIPQHYISRAYMITGDIGEVAELAICHGLDALRGIKIRIFHPVRPMLAQKAESVRDALREHGWLTAFEFKLDGLRAQIHKKGDVARIYSRRLRDVTDSFPEIVEEIKNNVVVEEAVLEGEIIGFKDGKPIPFQELMKRVRRIEEFRKYMRRIPVQIYLFDILYLNGEMLIDKAYDERRRILKEVAGRLKLVPRIVTSDPNEAERFFKEAVSHGHEGLMAKRLDSKYTLGTRGKAWLKIKRTLEPLDCVIVAAEWGYGRRKKWLSDYYLAVRDTEKNEWVVVGKTFKGLTDQEFEEITKRLLKDKLYESGRTVFVRPRIVVEVIYDEIQKSPKYESGYALRFARISRIRYDKTVDDADTIDRVREIYNKQRRYKASI